MQIRRRKDKKDKKQKRNKEIPVGSFSDIAFLLIIYFMVATTLVKVKSVQADMPAGETSQESSQDDDTPTINLVGTEIRYKEKLVSLEGLNERLASLKLDEKEGDKKVILLECSPDTAYDLYFKALAAIKTHGGVVALIEEEE
jgi:biopolymer transport protein ExbD